MSLLPIGKFRFFISGVQKEVLPDSRLWQLPLSGKISEKPCASVFTTGDYFLAACQFLSKNEFSILQTGLKSFLDLKSGSYDLFAMDQITNIKVFLEKHGAFYHPLKIEVILKANQTCFFVLNGAVSKKGLSLIEKEHNLLSRINKNNINQNINQAYPKYYLPQVFGYDFIEVDRDRARVGFFLGQWFENYKEFHVIEDNGNQQISIWESDGTCQYIQITDALGIYQEISKTLTYYYNIETFEQISSWHHAAGDFIVNLKNDKIKVKLITIREYSSLTQLGAGEKDQKTYILPSLLFFFLDMAIRMRIDRLNGTGRIVLIDKLVLNAIVKGFLSALDEKSIDYEKSGIYDYGDLKADFIEFFWQFDFEQLLELMGNIVKSCYSDPLETALIKENLNSHCHQLYSIFKNF